MRKFALAAAALLGAAVITSGCSSTYSREETIDNLMEDGGLTEEQATCVVDELEDAVGTDKLDEAVDKDPEELDPEVQDALTTAFSDCVFGDFTEDTTAEGE